MNWEEILAFLFRALLIVAGVALAYTLAKSATMLYRKQHDNMTTVAAKIYSYFICLLVVGGITLVVWSVSGAPSDCDECNAETTPTVTPEQRNNFGAKMFFLILLPSLVGVYNGLKAKPEDFPADTDNPAKEWLKEEEERKEAAEKIDAFGKLLAEGQPLIRDARKLPYPKQEIMVAYVTLERYLCDIVNFYIESDSKEGLAARQKELEWLRSGGMFLAPYTDIAPEDIEAVDYFNSYESIADVPEEERAECRELQWKYEAIGMEEVIPGWAAITDATPAERNS